MLRAIINLIITKFLIYFNIVKVTFRLGYLPFTHVRDFVCPGKYLPRGVDDYSIIFRLNPIIFIQAMKKPAFAGLYLCFLQIKNIKLF